MFDVEKPRTSKADLNRPQGYRGLARFHKYCGKKPVECLAYLLENLTFEQEIVLDPFIGYGLVAREALQRNRRFIGIDINPIAIELAQLIVSPPSRECFSKAVKQMERVVKPEIDNTYKLTNGDIATHFLWEDNTLKSVWCANGRPRRENEPTTHDIAISRKYSDYKTKYIRNLRFFSNSRINTSPQMTICDLFTGRALRNIDLILKFIKQQPDDVRKALLLTLTAASGQMSNMVFVVSNRGKTTGKIQERISVGSWVIGYWRPKVHFEINVWNCFQNKAKNLTKALTQIHSLRSVKLTTDCSNVIESRAQIALIRDDARRIIENLPKESISLVLTDPPHSDRMPYLELSELWNAILDQEVLFDREIIVSNAREREKGRDTYTKEMQEFFIDVARVLCDGGIMAILFNAYDSESWEYLKTLQRKSDSIRFRGCFPMVYSAGSVVQDNRKGALKHDYVLIYEKCSGSSVGQSRWKSLAELDGWSSSLPTKDK
jgi:16S rRNA G966 N2-methylase RsmD